MPTYEYRCPAGHEFEKFFRTISAAQPVVHCPQCGELAARQMSAGAGLMFKGSGFYLTDYGKNAHASKGTGKPAAKEDASAGGESKAAAGESKGDGGTPAGGDTKPAAPAAPAAPPAAPKPKPKSE